MTARLLLLVVALCAILAGVSMYLGRPEQEAAPAPAPSAAAPVTSSSAPAASPASPASARAGVAPEAALEAAIVRLRPLVAQEPRLVQALDGLLSAQSEVRTEAVQAVGFADDARLVPPIVFLLLNDPEAEVRTAAAAALDIHDASPEASRALVRALEDVAEEVRAGALLSLKAHRNAAAEKELRRVLEAGRLPAEMREEVRLFLDRYYVRRDPFKDPLAP